MRVVVYTKSGCPYSAGAKRLLEEKGIPFEEVNVTLAPERRTELEERAPGARTLPQVFLGDRHVGGYTELQELDRTSGLRSAVQEGGAAPP
jgi:glutaredoxin 3